MIKYFITFILFISINAFAKWDYNSTNGATLLLENIKHLNHNYKITKTGNENGREYLIISLDNDIISYALSSPSKYSSKYNLYYPGHYDKIAKDYCLKKIQINEPWISDFNPEEFINFIDEHNVKYYCQSDKLFLQDAINSLDMYLESPTDTLEIFCKHLIVERDICSKEKIIKFKNEILTLMNTTATSDALTKCTNLGFKKGTESLKNCVLELSR